MRAVVVEVRVVVPTVAPGEVAELAQALEWRDLVSEDLEQARLLDAWIEEGAVISIGGHVEDVEDIEDQEV